MAVARTTGGRSSVSKQFITVGSCIGDPPSLNSTSTDFLLVFGEPIIRRLTAGAEWIRTFCSALDRQWFLGFVRVRAIYLRVGHPSPANRPSCRATVREAPFTARIKWRHQGPRCRCCESIASAGSTFRTCLPRAEIGRAPQIRSDLSPTLGSDPRSSRRDPRSRPKCE